MGQLLLSILVFAPGLVALSAAALVGTLVLLERAGALGDRVARARGARGERGVGAHDEAANPPGGRIVSELHEAIADAGSDKRRKSERPGA